MTTLYFTATGNSLDAAKHAGGRLISIPQAMRGGEYEFTDDAVGFVFPVYAGCVPGYVADFLKKITVRADYIFALLTYGNYCAGACGGLMRLGRRHGIAFDYIDRVKMADNWLPGFDMVKQRDSEGAKGTAAKLAAAAADIAAGRRFIRGDMPHDAAVTALSSAVKPLSLFPDSQGYTVAARCTGCGVCEKVCPTGNAALRRGADGRLRPTFGTCCIRCLACIQNCPAGALHMTGERSAARFRNSRVTLAEIIASNCLTGSAGKQI
jgi:ferredoxin